MKNLIASDSRNLIVGAGATGLSVARHFEKLGCAYDVYDTRENRAIAEPFYALNTSTLVQVGDYDTSLLQGVHRIVLSPGVSRSTPIVLDALERGISVVSDITIFLEAANAPVVGITGTNGKSTVTTIVGLVAEAAKVRVAVGGNLGTPALDLLDEEVELYILELSSFQLESTDNANLAVAVHLNLSQDHLDRHGSFQRYFQAKQKIFFGAKKVVYNLDDPLTKPPIVEGVARFGFGCSMSQEKNEIQYTLNESTGDLLRERKLILNRGDIRIKGRHNLENVLAVLAITEALGLDASFVALTVKDFAGLPHRCEVVDIGNGLTYINDSKATNVGAAVSALEGCSIDFDSIVLIAGGVGKEQNFSDLGRALEDCGASAVLFGQDAEIINASIPDSVSVTFASSLHDAIKKATTQLLDKSILLDKNKTNKDVRRLVLFSPACASFDMFANFEARGDAFRRAVRECAA